MHEILPKLARSVGSDLRPDGLSEREGAVEAGLYGGWGGRDTARGGRRQGAISQARKVLENQGTKKQRERADQRERAAQSSWNRNTQNDTQDQTQGKGTQDQKGKKVSIRVCDRQIATTGLMSERAKSFQGTKRPNDNGGRQQRLSQMMS